MTGRTTLLAALLVLGCGDLKPKDTNTADGGTTGTLRHIEVTDEGGGTSSAIVDAHDEAAWIYLDLESGEEVAPADPAQDSHWDLAFQRFQIRTNGGTSGSGSAAAARLEGVSFADVTVAPSSGFVADSEDDGQSETGPAYAFLVGDGWYSYDVATHQLTARDVVYVVKTPEGHYFKVQLLGYYDGAGNPAHIKLNWAVIAGPATQDGVVVDASSTTAWAYLRIGSGGIAETGDDSSWDLAFQGVTIRTNSGTSGSGVGGARLATGSWASISNASTIGFVKDTELPLAGPPGSGTISSNEVLSDWYDYDSTTHQVSATDKIWLVRTAGGNYAKFQITAFDQSAHKFTVRFVPVSRKVETLSLTVEAAVSGSWVAVSLRDGKVVTVDSPSTSDAWDVAFSRTLARTNGGTSGPGLAGAVDTGTDTFANLLTAPATGYVVDEEAALPGPPGSGTASMNAALGAWYDYNATTHAVSPKATTYAIRTADGSYAKLQITGWADGVFHISCAYAGPAQAEL